MGTRALEILTDDPNRKKPFLTEIYPIGSGIAGGFGLICFANACLRKPVFSGIQMHVIASILGGALTHTVNRWRDGYLAERDAVLRRYVELHPELFPDPVRKKFSEVIEAWVPVR